MYVVSVEIIREYYSLPEEIGKSVEGGVEHLTSLVHFWFIPYSPNNIHLIFKLRFHENNTYYHNSQIQPVSIYRELILSVL